MIEIILRDDIEDYEPRPLFGFTYRQVVTAALIVACGAFFGIALTLFGLPNTIMCMIVMALCGGVGFVGLGKVHGLHAEQYFAIWHANHVWKKNALFCPPQISAVADRIGPETKKIDKALKKEIEADKKEAALEVELTNY